MFFRKKKEEQQRVRREAQEAVLQEFQSCIQAAEAASSVGEKLAKLGAVKKDIDQKIWMTALDGIGVRSTKGIKTFLGIEAAQMAFFVGLSAVNPAFILGILPGIIAGGYVGEVAGIKAEKRQKEENRWLLDALAVQGELVGGAIDQIMDNHVVEIAKMPCRDGLFAAYPEMRESFSAAAARKLGEPEPPAAPKPFRFKMP